MFFKSLASLEVKIFEIEGVAFLLAKIVKYLGLSAEFSTAPNECLFTLIFLVSTTSTNNYNAKVKISHILSRDTNWFLKHVALTVNSICIGERG